MAIKNTIRGGADLRVTSTISKRNLVTPLNGHVVGYWYGAFIQFPPSYPAENVYWPFFGASANNNGVYTGGGDTFFGIGSSSHQGRVLNQNMFTAPENDLTTLPAYTNGGAYFIFFGITNIGTDAAPVWRSFAGHNPIGGSPSIFVAPTAPTSFVTNVVNKRIVQIFNANGTTGRTPTETVIENVAIIDGNFPWDFTNDPTNGAPNAAIVGALAGGTNTPLRYTYESPQVLNGGQITQWWKLNDTYGAITTAGLQNYGVSGATSAGPVVVTAGTGTGSDITGLVTAQAIAPAHWAPPVLTLPVYTQTQKFHGGRGLRPRTVSGTYDTTQTSAVQRRWQDAAGVALPGFDWAAVTLSAGNWTFTDILPKGGPYNLRMRATNIPGTVYGIDDWLVGTTVTLNGQSGMYRSFYGSGDALNMLDLQLTPGVQALFVDLNYKTANNNGNYAQPTPRNTRLVGGTIPTTVGQGVVTFCNEWYASDGGPVMIVLLAIAGTAMGDWARNIMITSTDVGGGLWPFLGDMPPVMPGVSGPAGAGVMGTLALMANRYADVHAIMWTPGWVFEGDTPANNGPEGDQSYVQRLDERFNKTTDVPVLVIPAWRTARVGSDAAASLARRQWPTSFAKSAFLGARGYLAPTWGDVVNETNGAAHPAYLLVGDTSRPADANIVGESRAAAGMARACAWVFNPALKVRGPMMVKAYFTDASRTSITVETGRKLRTLNGAAPYNNFFISENNGGAFSKLGFSITSVTGTKVVLTKDGGAAFNATQTRIDCNRYSMPFPPGETNNDETAAERLLDGVLYDDQTHRGGTNLAMRAGNTLMGLNDASGIPVTDKDGLGPRLVSTARQPGTRTVVAELVGSDGTVLATTTVNVTAT